MKLLENVSSEKVSFFLFLFFFLFSDWNHCKARLVSATESTIAFIFNLEVGNQWQRYLWDIKSAANVSLFLLWRCMSAYSVWFVQPSNRHHWTEGSPSPTAGCVVVQTATGAFIYLNTMVLSNRHWLNVYLLVSLQQHSKVEGLFGLNLTQSYTTTKPEQRPF